MNHWTGVGRKKLATLIKRDDFLIIIEITGSFALIEFENQGCQVTGMGKVTWFHKD